MIIYIYSLIDPRTSKIRYVGKARDIEDRFKKHIKECRRREYHSSRWIRGLLNEGLKPIINILEEANEENWISRERYWIAELKKENKLTNISDGGEGGGRKGSKWSEQQHKNNKMARTGRKINQNDKDGKRRAAIIQYKEKTKKPVYQYDLDGNFLKKWDSAVDAHNVLGLGASNINKATKQIKNKPGNFQWRKFESEVPLKIEKYENRKDFGQKSVIQLDKSKNVINVFDSISEAAKSVGILMSSITNCLKGKSKSAGGYRWEYQQIENNQIE